MPGTDDARPDRPTPASPSGIDRRTALLGAGTAAAAALLPAGAAAAAPAGAAAPQAAAVLPEYTFLREALDTSSLVYNPTGELIFPCIRGTAGRLPDAPGRFLLYYAPHEEPGGICLAYADRLDRRFTEHPGNPIVANDWAPHYSVSHVSSPHVLWNAEHREMWLYFHGENSTTRLARSRNGIDFSYEGAVLTTAMVPGTTEASYARVFEHPLPERGARYVMVFMRNSTGDNRSIGWGWSADGITFDFDPDPLVHHADVGLTNLSGPHVIERGGSTYVAYHTDKGDIRLTEVGTDFGLRRHLGVVHRPMPGAPDSGRSAAPSYGSDGGTEYMFYEAGGRLTATIAIARAE
ncbi:hypothetical protein CLV63_10117 [Murinocardiopsis flavida]|uniref:Secreted protein n=1 Tax=Murinocardiopsis flavida TaxID=645275 RepID=A0A2P8DTJ7_9ACTN|nr:hypothetical protein [Murinocardiopsis flavida]PSL00543.1 hypothetical protein CLV63_10117 [Murinocardiopsis flavida]